MRHIRSTIVSPVVAAAMVALAASAGRAQVVPLPQGSSGQAIWISGAGALFNLQDFAGGADGANWAFGDGVQGRVGVERAIRRDMALGLTASAARLPVFISGGGCGGCEVDATAWQAMATLRFGGGGGIGFHSVFEASAGAAGFVGFTESEAGTRPTEPLRNVVPAVAASYGVGYGIWPGLEISLAQEIGILIYSPADNATNSTSTPRFNATRLLLRYQLPRR